MVRRLERVRGGFFRAGRGRGGPGEFGFTLIEILIVMVVVGVLAAAGVSTYGSFHRRQLAAEAEATWQELDMAIRLYRMDAGSGRWPAEYTHARHVGHVLLVPGALMTNLAPSDFDDPKRPGARAGEEMVGAPGAGGPTAERPTGHLVLEGGRVCVWLEGVPARSNDESCPPA